MRKSPRRQKRRINHKVKSSLPFLKIAAVLLLFLFAYLFVMVKSPYWNGKDKVNIVIQNDDGSVAVKVYDPQLEEITTLVIPGDTEVSVSRNLGTLRLKNVWRLGENEDLEGKLLAETVSKNFLFPVFLWQGAGGKTNVPLGDRLFLRIFEARTKNLQKTQVDLGKGQYVRRQVVSDGELGYKIVGEISQRLTVYFADNDFVSKSPKVYIKDKTGTFGVAERVGKVVEVMGGKVVTIERGEVEDSDCRIKGEFSEKIARVFSCKVEKDRGDYDLEINLGALFGKRF